MERRLVLTVPPAELVGQPGRTGGACDQSRSPTLARFHLDEHGRWTKPRHHLWWTIAGMRDKRPSGAAEPTIFRIVVRGELSRRYLPAFEGMALVTGDGQTAITGPVVDQAQLHGLLNRIGELGLELISVNPAPEPASTARVGRTGR
jgi:hypothetical protein